MYLDAGPAVAPADDLILLRSVSNDRRSRFVSRENRVATMAEKLVVYARRAGVDDVAIVEDAYWTAVQPRVDYFRDVFHIDVLHPARTALILIELGECKSGITLAAGQLTETFLPELRLQHGDSLNAHVWKLANEVPNPLDEDENLLEALVTAEEDVALIAVAERLDHARHLHMRDSSQWADFYQQTQNVYLPVAQRLHPELYARYHRWATAFGRRLR